MLGPGTRISMLPLALVGFCMSIKHYIVLVSATSGTSMFLMALVGCILSVDCLILWVNTSRDRGVTDIPAVAFKACLQCHSLAGQARRPSSYARSVLGRPQMGSVGFLCVSPYVCGLSWEL